MSSDDATTTPDGPAQTLPKKDDLPAPEWASLEGPGPLKHWCEELRASRGAQDIEDWRLTGTAVLLLCPDLQTSRDAIRRVAADAGYALYTFAPDEITSIDTAPEFTEATPAIVFLNPGLWQGTGDFALDSETETAGGLQPELVRAWVMKWTSQFDASRPIVLVTSAGQMGQLSEDLRIAGCFDRFIQLQPRSAASKGAGYIAAIGSAICSDALKAQLGKLGFVLGNMAESDANRGLVILHLRRLHRRTRRLLEMSDVLDAVIRGTRDTVDGPTAPASEQRNTALHEAGHALVCVVDSGGANVPDYCSIVPGSEYAGVMLPSVSVMQSGGSDISYRRFRHDIRVGLAGRAAEDLILGACNVTHGAGSDLATCYRRATSAFSSWGFAPGMDSPGASGSNLAVIVGGPSPSEYAHVESLTRLFLATEYDAVIEILAANRGLLESIADRLMWDPVLDQSELAELCRQAGVSVTAR